MKRHERLGFFVGVVRQFGRRLGVEREVPRGQGHHPVELQF